MQKDCKRNRVRLGTSQECVLVFLYKLLKGQIPGLMVYMSSINRPVDLSVYYFAKEISPLNHSQPVFDLRRRSRAQQLLWLIV